MKWILGSLLAAFAAFLWGFIFWQLLPWPGQVLRTLPRDQARIKETLLSAELPSGTYLIREDDTDQDTADPQKAPLDTPSLTLFVERQGRDPASTMRMILGFSHMFLTALVLGIVLIASGRREYFGRVMLSFWVGVLLALWTEPLRVIWFDVPRDYALLYMAYHGSTCLIMGLILAWFVQPLPDPSA